MVKGLVNILIRLFFLLYIILSKYNSLTSSPDLHSKAMGIAHSLPVIRSSFPEDANRWTEVHRGMT